MEIYTTKPTFIGSCMLSNQLHINMTKSVCMYFCLKSTLLKGDVSVTISAAGMVLQKVN